MIMTFVLIIVRLIKQTLCDLFTLGRILDINFHLEQVNNLKALSVLIDMTNNSTLKISGIYRCHQNDDDFFVIEQLISNNRECSQNIIIWYVNVDLIKFDKKLKNIFIFSSRIDVNLSSSVKLQ